MKKLLCLLFAALLLSSGVSALELPGGLDEAVPRELIESAEAGDDLIMHGGQYLFSHFRTALQSAAAKSLRGAMALMLLSLLCGLVEGTAESAGEQPARYAGYLGVLGAAAIASQDLSALIGVGVQTMDELAAMAKLLIPTVAAAMAGGGCVGSASVWQVGALMLSDLFLSLMRNVLVPLLYCMIAASAAGALLEQSRLSLLSKGIGRLLSWGLSAVLIVFTAFLSLTNLLAGSPTVWRSGSGRRSSPAQFPLSAASCPTRQRPLPPPRSRCAARSACWACFLCLRSALRRCCIWRCSTFSISWQRFSAL